MFAGGGLIGAVALTAAGWTVAAVGCDGAARIDGEPLGEALLPITDLGAEVALTPTNEMDHIDPSAAWIRMPDSGGSASYGHALVAYSLLGLTDEPLAHWSVSLGAWADPGVPPSPPTVPTYQWFNANQWDSGADPVPDFRWPMPENVCDMYGMAAECGGLSWIWRDDDDNDAHWKRPAAALWTGLDRVAAIVTTVGGGPSAGEENVAIVTSADGGLTFTNSYILSVDAADGTFTGGPDGYNGGIVPGSVHASLAAFGERTSPLAGQVSLPLYVTWQSDVAGDDPEWWWTRVVVGLNGEIAETMLPKRLDSTIPTDTPGTRVSIFGYRMEGQERVGVAWSESRYGTENPCDGSGRGVGEKQPVNWYAASTEDLGDSWQCFRGVDEPNGLFAGCDIGKRQTLITSTSAWPVCASGGTGEADMPNNIRPEVAVSAPAAPAGNGIEEVDFLRYFFFAINKPASTWDNAVFVYRTGGLALWDDFDSIDHVATSSAVDPDNGSLDVHFSHAQAIAVASSAPGGTDGGPKVFVTHRNHLDSGVGIRQAVMEIPFDYDPANVVEDHHNVSSATWPFTDGKWGRHSGIMAFEKCDAANTDCTGGGPVGQGDAKFLATWTAAPLGATPVMTRGFEWVP